MTMAVSKRNTGFTLIELLIALVIIGLLVGVVGPALFKNIGKSEVTTARAQIDSLTKAIDQYRLDTGHFPTGDAGLAALTEKPVGATRWNGPYLQKTAPADPWGRPYLYQSPGVRNADYDVYSLGRDGAPGGKDESADIGNW